jgi:hypothetical protein
VMGATVDAGVLGPNLVSSEMMPIKTVSIDEAGERWAQGSNREICRQLERPSSKPRYDRALSFSAGDIRKVTRTSTGQGNIRLSHNHLRQAQLESADKVRVVALPEGGLALLPATREECEARHKRASDSPPPVFPESEARVCRESFTLTCAECGQLFESRTPRRMFCDDCKHARALDQKLEWWKAHGKQCPSHLAKLKHRSTPHPAQMVLSI